MMKKRFLLMKKQKNGKIMHFKDEANKLKKKNPILIRLVRKVNAIHIFKPIKRKIQKYPFIFVPISLEAEILIFPKMFLLSDKRPVCHYLATTGSCNRNSYSNSNSNDVEPESPLIVFASPAG